MDRFRFAVVFLFCLSFGLVAKAAEPEFNFNRDIRPILSKNCFRCHGPDDEDRGADLRLDIEEGGTADLGGYAAVVPGKPEESAIIERILSEDEDMRMPPPDAGARLSPEQVDLLKKWIASGAKWEQHWSYVAPVRPALPQVKQRDWPANPIDYFVLQKLEANGLKPSPEASRYELIRRVTLDLTGVPPTIEEVDAFIADHSADAYDRLVDRLLASPAYGERWGRVWLDIARYADSAGYAQDPERVIWRYRDWVIQAINENKPFDQFTIEQLAGDMLPNPTESQIIATAFHRNTMTNSEGGTDDEEFRTAAVVDRVNTTMQAWMGLTMECAQCHTHKYDPITQEEYFKFYAVFNQTEDADRGDESPVVRTLSPNQQLEKHRLEMELARLNAEQTKVQLASVAKDVEVPTGELKTRFVRVVQPGKNAVLHLAEVQAFVGDKNLALTGTASQSSTGFGGPAQLAIDGNTNGHYFEAKSTSHTDHNDNPWWEVDLGSAQVLDRVVLWNRTDGNTHTRLANFQIILLDEKRNPLLVANLVDSPNPNVTVNTPKTGAELTDAQRAAMMAFRGTVAVDTALAKQIDDVKKQIAGLQGVPTPIMRELAPARHRKTHILLRGNFLSKGAEVSPGVPAVFPPLADNTPANRLNVARWLVDPANPLTARVTANRYWEQLFGLGIVETAEDFGIQGEWPSHPKLIDWLATELVRQQWDTKALVRLIVTSNTYRQTSRVEKTLAENDPYNRLFARGPRQRLSAEMVRDQALAAGGLLSSKMLGPSVRPLRPKLGLNSAFGGSTDWDPSPGEDKYRRGLYTSWRRTTPYPSMMTFDAPSREVCTVRRIPTNTPLQALVTLNDPVYVEAAQGLSRRILKEGGASDADRAKFAFRICVSRPPTEAELSRLVQLYQTVAEEFRTKPNEAKQMATDPIGPSPASMDEIQLAAWTVVGNVLLNLDETLARK